MSEKEIKVLDKGFVRLIDVMGNDAAIVQAARVSYGEGTKTINEDRGLIRYLLKHRHTSPLEMVEFKFHCKMPIFCARQWVRTRTASLNEVSGRYSVLPDEFYVPEPENIHKQSKDNKQGRGEPLDADHAFLVAAGMKTMAEDVFDHYHLMLKDEVAREVARINLPVSTYTEWYWKIDLHNLLHFLKLRLDKHAQWEMRQYAQALYELIKPIVPLACEAFEDYVLNAETFSAQELKILIELCGNCIMNYESMGLSAGLSKREIKEFKEKLGL